MGWGGTGLRGPPAAPRTLWAQGGEKTGDGVHGAPREGRDGVHKPLAALAPLPAPTGSPNTGHQAQGGSGCPRHPWVLMSQRPGDEVIPEAQAVRALGVPQAPHGDEASGMSKGSRDPGAVGCLGYLSFPAAHSIRDACGASGTWDAQSPQDAHGAPGTRNAHGTQDAHSAWGACSAQCLWCLGCCQHLGYLQCLGCPWSLE